VQVSDEEECHESGTRDRRKVIFVVDAEIPRYDILVFVEAVVEAE